MKRRGGREESHSRVYFLRVSSERFCRFNNLVNVECF